MKKFRFGETEAEDMVGVVTGLAWTEVGGEILTIESVLLPGKGNVKQTGKLGDVMQESVSAALSYVRSRSIRFGIKPTLFDKRDIHVHVPEGATPKDGPSAGVAMATSIVSILTGIPVRRDVAMTGEITLRGRIFPIGGLKEKLLAALRAGITTVFIPKENEKDLAVDEGRAPVPYRLPELMEAIASERTIFVVEGEKKADRLWSIGVPATCNCGGAGKWPAEISGYFKDAAIVVLPDNDPPKLKADGSPALHEDGRPMRPGRDHADLVAVALKDTARAVRVLELPELPPKGDVVDWLDAGGTVEALNDLVDTSARPWAPPSRESRFGLIMWADQDQPGEEYEYLVEDLIPEKEPVLIIGETQSGKSFFTRDLGLAGARGIHFYGRRVLRPFGVVYCAYEAGKGFNNRQKAYRRHHGLHLTELPFALLTRPADLSSNAVNVDQMIEENPVDRAHALQRHQARCRRHRYAQCGNARRLRNRQQGGVDDPRPL